MRAARTDSNHADVVEALRSAGVLVESLAGVGKGVPDLLCGVGGRLLLIEVKDGSKSPSQRTLTPDQVKWHEAWSGFPVYVITSVSQALDVVCEHKWMVTHEGVQYMDCRCNLCGASRLSETNR